MRISLLNIVGVLISVTLIVIGVLEITKTIDWVSTLPFVEQYQFLNLPSFLIVIGGVLNAVFIMYPDTSVKRMFLSFFFLFSQSRVRPKTLRQDIDQILGWANKIKDNRVSALNELQETEDNELARYLFSLMSTNYSSEEIQEFGEISISEERNRRMNTVEVLTSMGTSAPAFGMFGTLFGLIVMLGELDSPANLGPGLAAALITTLYGISLAHLIYFPLAKKLKNLAGMQSFRELLMLEGIIMINDKKSPFYIQDKLLSYLVRKYQQDEEMGTESSAKAA